MHPIRRGVMPTDRVHRLPQQAQPRAIPPHRPQPQHRTQPHILETRGNAAQRRLKRRLATEKHAPATRPLTAALISCLGTATPGPHALASLSVACTGTTAPSADSCDTRVATDDDAGSSSLSLFFLVLLVRSDSGPTHRNGHLSVVRVSGRSPLRHSANFFFE